jgi:hypothetical protein
MNNILFGAALLVFAIAGTGRASEITYDVDLTSGEASVTGFLETDGTIGTLSDVNFLDWNLQLNDGAATFDLLGPLEVGSNSGLTTLGNDISGSLAALTYDTSDTADGYLYVYAPIDGQPNFCAQNQAEDCSLPPPGLQWNANENSDDSASIATDGITTIGTNTVPEPSTWMMMFAALGISPLLRKCIVSIRRDKVTASIPK